jgi:hypothetical protein
VNPRVSPTTPVPVMSRRTVMISFATEDVIKMRGKDCVLSEDITTERNSIILLYDVISKIAIIIGTESKANTL